MTADVKISYADPGVSGNAGTATRQLAAQQVVNDNSDTVDVEVVSLAAQSIHSGGPVTNNTPGTPVALGSQTSCKHVTVQALGPNYLGVGGNTGYVWVGGSGVNASSKVGVSLPPGTSYELDINDISKVFFDVESTGDKVTFNYYL
jgi:hypothetical protein